MLKLRAKLPIGYLPGGHSESQIDIELELADISEPLPTLASLKGILIGLQEIK
jgi:hypothetical protein